MHDTLGFGFLESVYEKALKQELLSRGFGVISQQEIEVYYQGNSVGKFRTDLIVNNRVIIELKATTQIHPAHEIQLVNYLRATKIEVGLLINFGEELKFKRRVFSNNKKKNLNPI